MQDARPEGVAEGWADDVEKTAGLLEIRTGAAIRKVKKVLGADVGVDDVDCAGEEGEDGEDMGAVDDMELRYGSLESLQFAERGGRNYGQECSV